MRILLAVVLLVASAAARDHVTLRNGSLVTGDVVAVHREGVVLSTDGGTRFIPWSDLGAPGLSTANTVAIELSNGDRITGRITSYEDGKLVITADFFPGAKIPTVALAPRPTYRPIQQEPEIPPGALQDAEAKGILEPKEWNGSVALLGQFRSGNVDSTLFTLNAKLNRQWASDRFNAYVNGAWGETEGDTTAAGILGGAKWDHFYNKDFYSYGRIEAEYDEIQNIDLRFLAGIGGGLNVWRGEKDHQTFDIEAGIDYLSQSFANETSRDNVAGRFAFVYKNRFFDDWLFTEEFEVLFPIPDVGDYILRSITKLETALSENWYLQNVLEIELQGNPPRDTVELDIKLLIGLEYKF